MSEERLQKILARAGLGSRRVCEALIQAGRVTVDGRVVTVLGLQVDPSVVEIAVDGQPIALEQLRYIMLHKPAGYLSSPDPRAGLPSWADLVRVPERLYAVGRLDQDSEGLLLLTNDGDLALRLMHPRYKHVKTYLVEVKGVPNPRNVRRWQHGVMLDDGPTLPAEVEVLRQPPPQFAGQVPNVALTAPGSAKMQRSTLSGTERSRKGEAAVTGRTASFDSGLSPSAQDATTKGKPSEHRTSPQSASSPAHTTWLRFKLREGRKRQLRRMVALLGHPAQRVIRIGLGPLSLGDLKPGEWRDLTPGEIKALREAVFGAEQAHALKSSPERKTKRLIPTTIAIDGPSASGKSTIGGLLARELNYLYFDTGVMYRAVAAVALARGIPIEDEAAVTALAERVRLEVLPPTADDGRDVTVLADGQDITWDLRRRDVEKAVSPVSAYPGVRAALRIQQRRIGEAGRVVMVGRDIGTVVLPDAELKIYLDATLAERARRRFRERLMRGEQVKIEQVLQDMRRRDEIDSTRQHAPLTAAEDAIIVDSTNLTIAEVLQRVLGLVLGRADR